MSFKKILSLLLVLCMILSFTACGLKAADDEEDDDNGKKSSQSSDDEDEDEGDNEDEDSNDDEDEDSGDEDEDSKDEDEDSGDEEDSQNPYEGMKEVDLPKGYPDDVFPIYKGGKVYTATSDKRDGVDVYGAWVVFDTKLETVDKFYKDLTKDAEDFDDQSSSGFYIYTGKLGGYKFNLSLITDGTNADYTVMTVELTQIPTAENLLETLKQGELPDKYPADQFPIIDGGALNSASESESDGKVSYGLTIYTNKTFKEIVAFYEEKLGSIEDKSKTINTDDFDLRGTANNYYFSIYGGKATENNVELVRYYVNLDPVTE